MMNFSIVKDSQNSVVEQYRNYLNYAVYHHPGLNKEEAVYDYRFLQQLGLLQADEVQKAIKTNGAVLYEGLQYTNTNIRNHTTAVTQKMDSLAKGLTSSLERGFTQLELSLGETNHHLSDINTNLSNIGGSIERIGHSLRVEQIRTQEVIDIFRKQMGGAFDALLQKIDIVNMALSTIYAEMRIPEFQRERRYYMEQGAKYLKIAIKENDKIYYEDSIDAFNKAIDISRDDYFSWFYLGYIFLNSPHCLDINKSKESFERYIHYVRPEIESSHNSRLVQQLESVYLYMANISYLEEKLDDAVTWVEKCPQNEKTIFLKAKYLSAASDNPHKGYNAALLLKKEIQKNPYLSLQILGDSDLVSNQNITDMMDSLRFETVSSVKKHVDNLKKIFAIYEGFRPAYDKIMEIEKAIKDETYIEACEALASLREEKNWSVLSMPALSFNSSVIDYYLKYNSTINNYINSKNSYTVEECCFLLKLYDRLIRVFDNSETNLCRGKLLDSFSNLRESSIRRRKETKEKIAGRIKRVKDYREVLNTLLSIFEPFNKFTPYSESTTYTNYNTEDCDLEDEWFGSQGIGSSHKACLIHYEESRKRFNGIKGEIDSFNQQCKVLDDEILALGRCTYQSGNLELIKQEDIVIHDKRIDNSSMLKELLSAYHGYFESLRNIPSSVPKFPGFLSPFEHAKWIAVGGRVISRNSQAVSLAKSVDKRMISLTENSQYQYYGLRWYKVFIWG